MRLICRIGKGRNALLREEGSRRDLPGGALHQKHLRSRHRSHALKLLQEGRIQLDRRQRREGSMRWPSAPGPRESPAVRAQVGGSIFPRPTRWRGRKERAPSPHRTRSLERSSRCARRSSRTRSPRRGDPAHRSLRPGYVVAWPCGKDPAPLLDAGHDAQFSKNASVSSQAEGAAGGQNKTRVPPVVFRDSQVGVTEVAAPMGLRSRGSSCRSAAYVQAPARARRRILAAMAAVRYARPRQ